MPKISLLKTLKMPKNHNKNSQEQHPQVEAAEEEGGGLGMQV